MATGDSYTHVGLTTQVAESSDSEEDGAAYLEQGSSSGRCANRLGGRGLLIGPLALVGLMGVLAVLENRQQRVSSSRAAPSFRVSPAKLVADWSLVPTPAYLTPPSSVTSLVGQKVKCDADIVVQTKLGSMRVKSAAYKGGDVVPLFDKAGSALGVPCAMAYSVACVRGLVTIQVTDSCQGPSATVSGTGFKRFIGQTGHPKEITIIPNNEVVTFHSPELSPLSAGSLQIIATTETCEALSAGTCRQGCCKPGFQCAFQNKLPQAWRKQQPVKIITGLASQDYLGVCMPTRWMPEQVCRDPADPACRNLVEGLVSTSSSWDLIITSGGGGGHWSAAMNIAAKSKKKWAAKVALASTQLTQGAALLTPFGTAALARTIQEVAQERPPIEVVDIMNSPCTNLLGQLGIPMGYLMTGTWDRAQQIGDIPALKALFEHQNIADNIFYKQCLSYMNSVLKGDLGKNKKLPHVGAPSQLIATEPMMMPSITEAVEILMKEGSPLDHVDFYMTDLPGEDNQLPLDFGGSIKRMQKYYPERSHRLVLHTVAPLTGGAATLASNCDLDVSQVVIEPFLPVNAGFYEGGMPKPGTATQIFLKGQIPEEEAFLGAPSRTFAVAAVDVVVLVMLGSQPTIKAIHTYLNQSATLQQPPVGAMRWVFIACGPHAKTDFRDLYVSIAAKAAQLNKEQEAQGLRLRFVPFTGQPAQPIEARAEVTITRSGGMTAGELLALDARGDNKQVLIHIEEVNGVPAKPPCCDLAAEQAWEDKALGLGMVTWEAGNARYLMNKLGAKLITPETFAASVKYL